MRRNATFARRPKTRFFRIEMRSTLVANHDFENHFELVICRIAKPNSSRYCKGELSERYQKTTRKHVETTWKRIPKADAIGGLRRHIEGQNT
jgi:hypothetical protein